MLCYIFARLPHCILSNWFSVSLLSPTSAHGEICFEEERIIKKKRKECLIIVSKIAFVCTNWCWSEEKLLQTCTHTVNLFYHLLKKLQLQLHIFFKREWDKSLMLQIWKLICMCQVCSVYCLTLIKKKLFFHFEVFFVFVFSSYLELKGFSPGIMWVPSRPTSILTRS